MKRSFIYQTWMKNNISYDYFSPLNSFIFRDILPVIIESPTSNQFKRSDCKHWSVRRLLIPSVPFKEFNAAQNLPESVLVEAPLRVWSWLKTTSRLSKIGWITDEARQFLLNVIMILWGKVLHMVTSKTKSSLTPSFFLYRFPQYPHQWLVSSIFFFSARFSTPLAISSTWTVWPVKSAVNCTKLFRLCWSWLLSRHGVSFCDSVFFNSLR